MDGHTPQGSVDWFQPTEATGRPEPEVRRGVLRSQIKDVLMWRIVEGVYPPGVRLIESRIARELGVSQGPVREALRDLESVGVIETSAFRGARVRHPTPEELLDAFPVRAALESLAAEEVAKRATAAMLTELEGHIKAMVNAAEAGDAHAQALANAEFHRTIVRMAGNPTLERVWGVLEPYPRTYLTAAAAMHAEIDLRLLAERHRRILQPIAEHDGKAAAAAMRQHLLEAAEWLKEGEGG